MSKRNVYIVVDIAAGTLARRPILNAIEVGAADARAFFGPMADNERMFVMLGDEQEWPLPCDHDWQEGFDMAGPTLLCKRCGTFRRD